MSSKVAALYVAPGGVYCGLPNVDPWHPPRDAREYAGPYPVICHPPCSRWCQLAPINQKRYGHKVGDDGGCFAAALEAVRRWGGVLEHPAYTHAWKRFYLPRPYPGSWQLGLGNNEWVTEVSQCAYGHPARKRTWLYANVLRPPLINWSEPQATSQVSDMGRHRGPVITAQVSFLKNHGNSRLPRLSKKVASATPIPFRDLLLDIARSINV